MCSSRLILGTGAMLVAASAIVAWACQRNTGTIVPSQTNPPIQTSSPTVGPAATQPATPTAERRTPPALTPTSSNPKSLVFSDHDNGRSVAIPRGGSITVFLMTTSWTFQSSSDPSVITQLGATTYQSGNHCVPGEQCGTTTAQFSALVVGNATLIATRNYCGEARQCVPQNDTWTLSIIVRPG